MRQLSRLGLRSTLLCLRSTLKRLISAISLYFSVTVVQLSVYPLLTEYLYPSLSLFGALQMERRVMLFMGQGFERAEDVLQAAGVTVNTIQAKCGNTGDGESLNTPHQAF